MNTTNWVNEYNELFTQFDTKCSDVKPEISLILQRGSTSIYKQNRES